MPRGPGSGRWIVYSFGQAIAGLVIIFCCIGLWPAVACAVGGYFETDAVAALRPRLGGLRIISSSRSSALLAALWRWDSVRVLAAGCSAVGADPVELVGR